MPAGIVWAIRATGWTRWARPAGSGEFATAVVRAVCCCPATGQGVEGITFAFGESVELDLLLGRERVRESSFDEGIEETTHVDQLPLYFFTV